MMPLDVAVFDDVVSPELSPQAAPWRRRLFLFNANKKWRASEVEARQRWPTCQECAGPELGATRPIGSPRCIRCQEFQPTTVHSSAVRHPACGGRAGTIAAPTTVLPN